MTLRVGQVFGAVEEQGAVQPQIFSEPPHLFPAVPGERWWVSLRKQVGHATQLSNRGRIGWRQLEPLANGAMIDAELPADGSSRCAVHVQFMDLGDAQRSPCQTPAIAFLVFIVLIWIFRGYH